MSRVKGLLERLGAGETVICAEGYLFEFERRGYLKAGHFVPEVVLEHPHLVKNMHEEFVHAGSDVVEAFTYYGHRQKLKIAGREDELEKLNKTALRIAREVADATGTLMAGNICNTTIFSDTDPTASEKCRDIFKEQILWAVEAKADYIIAETFGFFDEAALALKCIKEFAPGLPAVITFTTSSLDHCLGKNPMKFADVCRNLEELGADVVGLNCYRGPESILHIIKEVREKCKGPIACLPVPYRTTLTAKSMQDLKDPKTGKRAFPEDLDAWLCPRFQITEFTKQLQEIGVQYMGLCCGNRAHYTRAMAEALGRTPPSSKYSADMSQHMSQIKGDEYTCNQSEWQRQFNMS